MMMTAVDSIFVNHLWIMATKLNYPLDEATFFVGTAHTHTDTKR